MLSIFSVHPALRGHTSVRFLPPWYSLASPFRLDTQTPFTGYFSGSSFILLFLFCAFFRVLWIHLAPLGPSLLTPTPAWQYPLLRPFSCFALCLFFGSLYAFGSLARILALFLTMSAFAYRDPASVSVFRALPHFSFLYPRS